MQNLCEWVQYEWDYCDTIDKISFLHNVLDELTEIDFGEDEYYVRDNRGYFSIFRHMVAEMEQSGKVNIKTNSPVTKVDINNE